jgi:hypothetical protein
MKRSFIATAFFTFILTVSASAVVYSQTAKRIIRADRNTSTEDPVLEVTGIKLGDKPIRLNELVSADENWLKNVKITVKNVGDRDLTFVMVVLGLLDTVDYKMRPEESWGYNMVFSYGHYGKRKPNGKGLKKGAEMELTYEHVDPSFRGLLESAPFGKFHKAVLEWATVVFKDGKEDDIRLRLPADTAYPNDESF